MKKKTKENMEINKIECVNNVTYVAIRALFPKIIAFPAQVLIF
jgi:hypothetical protein